MKPARRTKHKGQFKKGKAPKGKPFQPGQSGNPSGKPKGSRELALMCREVTPDVVRFWIETYENERVQRQDRLRASENIVAYGYGRAPVKVELTDDTTTKRTDVFELLAARLKAITGKPPVIDGVVIESAGVQALGAGGDAQPGGGGSDPVRVGTVGETEPTPSGR